MEKTINKGFATKAQAQMHLEAADAANRMHMHREREGKGGGYKGQDNSRPLLHLSDIHRQWRGNVYARPFCPTLPRQKSEKPCRLMLHFPFWPQSRGARGAAS